MTKGVKCNYKSPLFEYQSRRMVMEMDIGLETAKDTIWVTTQHGV
jgi:hypothetical protein